MDRFVRLSSFLESCLANPESSSLSKVQLKLERARPSLINLLDVEKKDTKEREQLEKGSFTYVATGTTYPAGPALVKDILFLSDELSVSENLCASYVSYGINSKPTSPSQGRAETGLIVHLDERAALISCLLAIWRGALSVDQRLSNTGLQSLFERETELLVKAIDGRWIKNIIDTLDELKKDEDRLSAQAGQGSGLDQNQGQLIVPTTTPSSGSFSDEIQRMRIDRFRNERKGLAQLLFFLAAAHQIDPDQILSLVKKLSSIELEDPTIVYLVVTLLAAIDCSDQHVVEHTLYPLLNDSSFVNSFNQLLNSKWKVDQIKATVELQWTIFLDAAARSVPNFENDGGEYVDTLTWRAIDNGVFGFLGRFVLAYKWDNEAYEIWGSVANEHNLSVMPDKVEKWFRGYVTEQIENLVLDVLTNKISILRKLRNREEDVVNNHSRGGAGAGGFRSSTRSRLNDSSSSPEKSQPIARHDLESFFLLIATLYRNEPDSGLKFWEQVLEDGSTHTMTSRLSAFLRWGSECRPPAMMRAFYEMVASLASGPISATYAFEFLSSNSSIDLNGKPSTNASVQGSSTFSWSALFGALEFYQVNLPDRPIEAGSNAEGGLGEMPPEEVPILKSFIRLLKQVVSYSDIARATLYDNQRHRPIATLFALLARPVPIELKASLISAIAAFSRPGGSFGVEVARRTWTALEQSQILPTLAISEGRDSRGGVVGISSSALASTNGMLRGSTGLSIEGGILTELEEVEAPNKIYPESTEFINLLNTLIHTPDVIEPLRRGVEIDHQTIPDHLGAPHRAPGIDPYLRFVIDDVLLKTGQREFIDQRERWKVTDVGLTFVEKCLASYDLGPFLAWIGAGGQRSNASISPLTQLTVHPGFEILSRLLSASPLLEQILTIIIAGLDAIRNDLAGTPLFTTCMLRCMRIIKRTLELQAPFLEVVLPALAESSLRLPQDKLNRLKTLAPLDQLLLYHSEAIVQIALLIDCEERDEIALLSIQILSTIAESPFFDVVQKFPEQSRVKLNRLVGLLRASPETLRILQGVMMRLEEDVPQSDLEEGEWDGSSTDDDDSSNGKIRQAIKSNLLDLLLRNTQPSKAAPNIAHLLMGFDVKARQEEMQIDDPDAADTTRTSLHVVLDILAMNVEKEADVQMSSLARHPTFAAKCYRLIRQLCLHPYTSIAVSRYLRNREQFFLRQTLALPFPVPAASEGALGAVQYADGKQIVTSSSAVCAILQSQAWLLESTALELSVLSTGQDTRRQVELVAALFENPTSTNNDGDEPVAFDRGGLDQALPRMLEIFHSFDFSWQDSITPNESRLSFFADLRFDSCLKIDSTGCEVYVFGAVLSLLSAARRELQNRGMLNNETQQEEAKRETKAIMETLVVENHWREIQFARFHALRAWRSLLDITLTKAFHLLPSEGRHSLLLDLMSAILPPLAAQETEQAISELLAGAAVLLMTKLRDEGIRVVFIESTEAVQSVSPERLHVVLRLILQAILQPGVSPVVRGNLYAVLLNYIQYSSKMASLSPALSKTLGNGSIADDASMLGSATGALDDLISLDGISSFGGSLTSSSRAKRNLLESGNFAILQSAIERLLPVICRDAAAGHEVWRTVAFTVLDALLTVAEEARATSRVLSILTKQGYLQSFVASLKDAEADLQEALKPDPESLNALYVYEAQMSFLIRLSSTREGAEKLINAELLAKLADCDYLGSRPVVDTNSMDFEGFLPPATERHHQLLLPALQLVVGTLVSFGADTQIATRQALSFVGGQRENLLVALKDCANTQTVSSLREAHLIVTLLSIVLPSISDEDLTTLSSFGGLHSALLNLSAKICGGQDWVKRVLPSNETEREEDQTLVLGFRNDSTIFTDKVESLVESLEASILTYQSVATRKRAGTNAFRPVWAPSLSVSEGTAAGATLGSAGAFLRDTTKTLKQRLEDVTRVVGYLDGFDTISPEEIEEAFSFPEEDEIDAGERRQRISQELQALHSKFRLKAASSLHLLELSLLLFWRHVAFYLDTERIASEAQSSRPEFGLGLAESLRNRSSTTSSTMISQFDLPNLRSGLSSLFNDSLCPRFEELEFNAKNIGSGWRNREQYLGVVMRRLKEVLMLSDEMNE